MMNFSEERRKRRYRKQRREQFLFFVIFIVAVALIIAALFFGIRGIIRLFSKGDGAQNAPAKQTAVSPAPYSPAPVLSTPEAVLKEAERLAASYDYDKAISVIREYKGYENNAKLSEAITKFEETKATMVPANVSEVTHVFFHTLVQDNAKAFDGEYTEAGYNQYMTTVSEFRAMLRIMHERGFVLVNLDDMAKMETDENGVTKMTRGQIMLPPGKKPLVISQDDVSYYQYMQGDGFATRLVIGEDGYPTCEYVHDDGSVTYGDYDLVPILEKFIQEHPDFSYRGARATLAITGYDGVLGYRTSPTGEGYSEEEVQKAKVVADRMREIGWVFASHSWGHQLYGSISTEKLRTDAQKWEDEVQPILGDSDVIIYAHGEDIAGIEMYSSENEKFNILKGFGFRYFCNVDAHQYWVQIGDDYLRQGRRNLDGYRMYYNPEMLSDLFDVDDVFDSERPLPVPPI